VILSAFNNCCKFSAFGQTELVFTPASEFLIPTNNGSISFAVNGTYKEAYLENGFWNFLNLRFDRAFINYSISPGANVNRTLRTEPVNLKVSAEDSNVKISNCQVYNSTFAGSRVVNALIRYAADGYGKQIFDIGLGSDQGDWSVTVDGEFIGKNHGWSLTPEGTLTVMNTDENVTLTYWGFPVSYLEKENGSVQSFLNEHSITIATIAVVAITLVVAIAIYAKNRKHEDS
jgi:hypothetical protein